MSKTTSTQWTKAWKDLEAIGIPVDSSQASRWDKAQDANAAPLAAMLLRDLDTLSSTNLDGTTVQAISKAIQLAFEMGRRSV